MVNRFITRHFLALGLVFFMGQTASATISNTSTTQIKCTTTNHLLGLCSIQVEGLLKGLGNVTKTPTAFAVTVVIQEGKVFCKNPAGNTLEGNGVPFRGAIALDGGDTINAGDVTKNGKSLKDIVFHDWQLIDAVIAGGVVTADQIACPNPGWIQIILVKKLQVFGEQFTDPTPTDTTTCDLNSDPLNLFGCTLVDALGTQCSAPVVADDKTLVWEQFTYGCTEICHDATGQTCPVN
jgi:hypothetical protein